MTVDNATKTPSDQKVLDLHLAGASYQQIADLYGLSRERIRQKIWRADPEGYFERRQNRHKQDGKNVVDNPEAAAAIELAKECSAKMDEARELLSTLATQRADAIRAALAAGVSQPTVALALGVTNSAINNALRQH